MPRNKRPLPRKSNNTPQPNPDAQMRELAMLALTIIERGEADTDSPRDEELLTLVRRALRRKHDDVLYGAVEFTKLSDPDACRYLRDHIEEEAASQRLRREGAPELEIDAFMVPLFVRSMGGLKESDVFQDEAAFDELVRSFKRDALESEAASVVLVRHLYDLEEVNAITYGALHEIVREAAASMTSKKPTPVPLLEASMRGWSGEDFEPDDEAMELRFLLGFALKRADDPFYAAPENEADSEAYFDARMERYRAWTQKIAPVLKRCLSSHPDDLEVNFLYQDLFFGARSQGAEELAMLVSLAEVNHVLGTHALALEDARAVVAVLDGGENALLRTNLYRGEELVGTLDRPIDLSADLGEELDTMCEALLSFGVGVVETAADFNEDGQPEGPERFVPA